MSVAGWRKKAKESKGKQKAQVANSAGSNKRTCANSQAPRLEPDQGPRMAGRVRQD